MSVFENTSLIIIISTVGALLAGLVLFLARIEKLWEYYKRYDIMKRKRFAEKQQPHCQVVCPAPTAMVEVAEKLENISNQLADNTKMTLDISSDRLIQKSEHFIGLGYMPEFEKAIILKMFINYYLAGGNGHAMYMIDKALKLPDTKNGKVCDVDLSYILETEIRKREEKEN